MRAEVAMHDIFEASSSSLSTSAAAAAVVPEGAGEDALNTTDDCDSAANRQRVHEYGSVKQCRHLRVDGDGGGSVRVSELQRAVLSTNDSVESNRCFSALFAALRNEERMWQEAMVRREGRRGEGEKVKGEVKGKGKGKREDRETGKN